MPPYGTGGVCRSHTSKRLFGESGNTGGGRQKVDSIEVMQDVLNIMSKILRERREMSFVIVLNVCLPLFLFLTLFFFLPFFLLPQL